MEIKIIIKNQEVSIRLLKNKTILDRLNFEEARNISEKLLPAIDKILRKNKLTAKEIKKFTLDTDLGESFTTYRIAKTLEKTFNWAVKA